MIRHFYIIILTLLASTAIAQDEETAKRILDEFSDKLNTYQWFKENTE